MKRKKKVEAIDENAPIWRKKQHTGPHTMPDGRKIECGQTVRAYPNQLAGAIDKFEQVLEASRQSAPAKTPHEQTITPVHAGGGRWNVVDASGKKLNDILLTKEEATQIADGDLKLEDLEPPEDDENEDNEEEDAEPEDNDTDTENEAKTEE